MEKISISITVSLTLMNSKLPKLKNFGHSECSGSGKLQNQSKFNNDNFKTSQYLVITLKISQYLVITFKISHYLVKCFKANLKVFAKGLPITGMLKKKL